MKIAILTVLVLLVAGCGCEQANDLVMTGDAPPHTDVVLQVAAEHCSRPLVGQIRWVAVSEDGVHEGYCLFDHCGMDVWVVTVGAAETSGLAHEIGHYCLRSEDEKDVEAWAVAVKLEAIDRISAGH